MQSEELKMQFNNNYQQQQAQMFRNNIPIVNNNSNILKGRFVSSIDEARASSVDFDGSIFFFPDLANKRIYTKQINVDGTSSMQCYELTQLPAVVPQTENYITRDEFNRALKELAARIPSTEPPQKKETTYEF